MRTFTVAFHLPLMLSRSGRTKQRPIIPDYLAGLEDGDHLVVGLSEAFEPGKRIGADNQEVCEGAGCDLADKAFGPITLALFTVA